MNLDVKIEQITICLKIYLRDNISKKIEIYIC